LGSVIFAASRLLNSLFCGAGDHAKGEFIGVALSGFFAEEFQAAFLFIVVFCSEGVVLERGVSEGCFECEGWGRMVLENVGL
jgi:hypothetical protein